MEKDFAVTILTPEKKVYEGRVVSLIAPCSTGYWGILADHAPLIANVERGKIILREKTGASQELQAASKGFLEVFENNVTLLI